jgi:uncharacterized membrane protein SirB2
MQAHAIDNLRYIRETMERAGSFTAVPGWGGVAMGGTALLAAGVAAALGHELVEKTPGVPWLATWMLEGMVALAIGLIAMRRKALAAGSEMWSAPARKFAFSFAPPMAAGAILTFALWNAGLAAMIPGTWMILYGAGVMAGGAFSASVVPVMGACFLAFGGVALFTPAGWNAATWNNSWMAASFGGLHVVFGWIIARRYGG